MRLWNIDAEPLRPVDCEWDQPVLIIVGSVQINGDSDRNEVRIVLPREFDRLAQSLVSFRSEVQVCGRVAGTVDE